jgi:hypothetical protein
MARAFAEAQIDLNRIRRARRHVCSAALKEGADNHGNDLGSEKIDLGERMRQLDSLDRYERRALSRRKSAARTFDAAFMEAVRSQGSPATICDTGAGSK